MFDDSQVFIHDQMKIRRFIGVRRDKLTFEVISYIDLNHLALWDEVFVAVDLYLVELNDDKLEIPGLAAIDLLVTYDNVSSA